MRKVWQIAWMMLCVVFVVSCNKEDNTLEVDEEWKALNEEAWNAQLLEPGWERLNSQSNAGFILYRVIEEGLPGRTAVFDDPAFDVRGQAVILAYFQARPLRGQVFPVCGFGYVRAIPFFLRPVTITVYVSAPLNLVVNRTAVYVQLRGNFAFAMPCF